MKSGHQSSAIQLQGDSVKNTNAEAIQVLAAQVSSNLSLSARNGSAPESG
jgi:hypothetical protein